MPYNKKDEDAIIRGYIKGRIKERGAPYARRLFKDHDYFDSEFQDIKEFLAYEKGIEFADE